MNNSECAFSDLRGSYQYNLSLSLLLEAFKRINLTFIDSNISTLDSVMEEIHKCG